MSFEKIDYKNLPPLEQEVLKRINGEWKVVFTLFVIFGLYMVLVPVLNFTAPDFMKTRVWGGMSLTWFLTAIGGAFMSFGIAAVHVYSYIKDFFIEDTYLNEQSKEAGV